MSNNYLPLNGKDFLEVFQPNYGFEYSENRFITGTVFRDSTDTVFSMLESIKLVYSKCGAQYMQTLFDFYHEHQLVENFLVDTTNLVAVNPYLRINPMSKWIFDSPPEVNQTTFGQNFVELTIMIKQVFVRGIASSGNPPINNNPSA